MPEIPIDNKVAAPKMDRHAKDWRLAFFDQTKNLKSSIFPFIAFASGNVAFPRECLNLTNLFDEEFNAWGNEDTEFAYRLFRHGFLMEPVMDAVALHQDPPGGENEVDRVAGFELTDKIFVEKCPLFKREPQNGIKYDVPKYSLINCSSQGTDIIEDNLRKSAYQDFTLDPMEYSKYLFLPKMVLPKQLYRDFLDQNHAAFFILVKEWPDSDVFGFANSILQDRHKDLSVVEATFNEKYAGQLKLVWSGRLGRRSLLE